MSLNLLYLLWFGDKDCFCFLIIWGRIDKRDVIPTVFLGTLLIVLIVLSCSFTLGVVESHLLWLTFYHDQLWRRDSYWVDESHFIFFSVVDHLGYRSFKSMGSRLPCLLIHQNHFVGLGAASVLCICSSIWQIFSRFFITGFV